MRTYSLLLLFLCFKSGVPYCWKPNHNPFQGVPEVTRLDASSVRLVWEDIFPKGTGCEDVDFLIKSHPLESPSNYKLSDFTLRGQRSATLTVPSGSDFIFQVIAREDKGSSVGIEYAYSRPATSLANPTDKQKDTLKKSIWVAGTNSRTGGNGDAEDRYDPLPRPTLPSYRQPRPTTPATPQPRPSTTAALQQRPTTPSALRPRPTPPTLARDTPSQTDNPLKSFHEQYSNPSNTFHQETEKSSTERVYLKPQVKALDSNPDYYNGLDENVEVNPWYIYECVPLLKNLPTTQESSNSILKKFIQHMNGNAVHTVRNFISNEKSCNKEERKRGHLVSADGTNKCCSTPWGDNSPQSVCYDQFARCDGDCIPQDWIEDGWPDCMDGADESNLAVDGKVLPFQLGCIHCAGVVLSAGFLCRESGGLTRSCVEGILGPGECNVCIGEYMNL
ncbi:uncharacterized protein LOC111715424 [Eurytemora carolleeae]|uniref:uncharacterized protein LOC111715424 n=1 Tax=Eurytemora carolleeae TaxID=1294199 RepID=UPI000C775753|nr:uncharacterized protein LOC111715424 [Eurytemora carolleeae]|eukprot:XP_023346509.1 uncharacterized protein LOC111715424 [Eurytemora affinis]